MRIVTYNIRGGLGMDGLRDIQRIGEHLASINADIVCLQEVHERLPQSGLVDQVSILSDCLDLPCYFSSAMNIGNGRYGIASFTRLTALDVRYVRLPNMREHLSGIVWRERRTAMELVVEVEGQRVSIWNTHWSLNAKDRLLSAARLATEIQAKPTLICGDFNSLVGSPEIERLVNLSGCLDADKTDNQPTFPADIPCQRIDMLFHTKEFRVTKVTVDKALWSDHLPVIVDIKFHVKQDSAVSSG